MTRSTVGLRFGFQDRGSFTGEDVVELHIHGGVAVVTAVLGAIGELPGTRMAEPGEFTRRSFMNDKMDLTGAEGLADLINAETEGQRRQALRQASGALGAVYEAWRTRLMRALAHAEAVIDFPDEELPEDAFNAMTHEISMLERELSQHIDDNRNGERLRAGLDIAIVGPPNAGKSSLLNMLAGRDAAIVSETAGTTRDVIEVRMDLGGIAATLSDTAGIRAADEAVEAEGVRRARQRALEADLRIVVFDGSGELAEADDAYTATQTITVLNKSDQGNCIGAFSGGRPGCVSAVGQTRRWGRCVCRGFNGVGEDPVRCGRCAGHYARAASGGIGGLSGRPSPGPRRDAAGIDGGGFTSRDAGVGSHYRAVLMSKICSISCFAISASESNVSRETISVRGTLASARPCP